MGASLPINRRSLLAGGAFGAMGLPAASAQVRRGPRVRRANILLILTDQQRALADIPSALPLPAHDWLRARGVHFEKYCVNTTPCGPSRATIYTGQHTQRTGVYANPNSAPYPQLRPETPTIGRMLRDAGYRTAYKGKWHLSNINEGLNLRGVAGGVFPNTDDALEPFGFSHYNFDGDRVGLSWEGFISDRETAADAVNQLRAFQADEEAPWFMAVNFVNPHDIMFYDPTGDGEQTRIRPNIVAPLMQEPGDPIYDADWGAPLPRSFYLDDLSRKPRAQAAVNATLWAFYSRVSRANEAAWLRNQNYYFNCIRDVDRHVALVLSGLEASGQADNTIIVFSSDHGERAGAHGMRQKGGTVYKEDVGVPLIIVHPDVAGGWSTHALASSVDLAPTILSLAGVSSEVRSARHPQLVGHDLSPALQSSASRSARDEAGVLFNYAVRYGWNAPDVAPGQVNAQPLPAEDLTLRRLHRGVYDGRYKFARYFAPAQHHMPRTFAELTRYNDLELYDTDNDSDEIDNLAWRPSAHRALLMRLNETTNRLIAAEVREDRGAEYPGDSARYNTLRLI